MIYAIAAVLILCFAFASPEWLLSATIIQRMTCHHFFHGNVFHLAANMMTSYFVFKKAEMQQILCAYMIASLSIMCSTEPVIGFSNMIYAMIGLKSPRLNHSWWKHPYTIIFLVMTLAMALIPNISAITHIVSFCGGVTTAVIRRALLQIKNDSARYI